MGDIDPKNESFSLTGMKLPYKGPASKQWVAKAMANAGFNLANLATRLSNTLVSGSDPVPPALEVFGSSIFIHQHWAVGDPAYKKIDDSIDWRDRYILFLGGFEYDTPDSRRWGGNAMYLDWHPFMYTDNNDSGRIIGSAGGPMMSMVYTDDAGSAAAGQLSSSRSCYLRYVKTGGTTYTAYLGPDGNGQLNMQGSAPAVGANNIIFGWLMYTEQIGMMNVP